MARARSPGGSAALKVKRIFFDGPEQPALAWELVVNDEESLANLVAEVEQFPNSKFHMPIQLELALKVYICKHKASPVSVSSPMNERAGTTPPPQPMTIWKDANTKALMVTRPARY
jgi:hypothetical protein